MPAPVPGTVPVLSVPSPQIVVAAAVVNRLYCSLFAPLPLSRRCANVPPPALSATA